MVKILGFTQEIYNVLLKCILFFKYIHHKVALNNIKLF